MCQKTPFLNLYLQLQKYILKDTFGSKLFQTNKLCVTNIHEKARRYLIFNVQF